MSWAVTLKPYYLFSLALLILGCASSVSPVLKYPLLNEGEKFATVTVKHAVSGPRSNITAFIITDANGNQKAYAPISTESIGKSALKAAYAWTPWGVATRMVHMNKGAIYHVPPIEMSIKLESSFWEGPIREYISPDGKKYQVWRTHRWESYIHHVKLDPDKEYSLNTPDKLYGKPTLINASLWSAEKAPLLEIKKTKEEEIHVDEDGKQNAGPE
jgi:hypothetical protein